MVSVEAAEAPAKINYRSLGRGCGGVLKKRRSLYVRDFDKPAASTIPAKFETVLYRNNGEKKGFGAQAPRLMDRLTEQVPGPGAYGSPGTEGNASSIAPQDDAGSSGFTSVGRRGNAAFATRVPRLPRSQGTQGPVPGPGAYEAAGLTPRGSAGAAPSAAFVLPGSVNLARLYLHPSPGPGDYADGLDACTTHGPRSPRSARIPRAGVDRDDRCDLPADLVQNPGPGHYDVCSARSSSLPPPGWTIGSSRRRLVSKASAPNELIQGDAEMLAEKEVKATPGPGDYETGIGMGPTHFGNRGHSFFQQGLSHLPRQWRSPLPGPGEYHSSKAELPGAPVRASFVSGSPRFEQRRPQAPGPAYYSPRTLTPAQSFNLNLKDGWL